MIIFEPCSTGSYRERTFVNAGADFTLAIATDFTTAGEKLTQQAAKMKMKQYFALLYQYNHWRKVVDNDIVPMIDRNECATWNIAGNGLYTLVRKDRIHTQADVDTFTLKVLERIIKKVSKPPVLINSGGQTGIDEAGLKAADRILGKATCIAPNDWVFRTDMGTDIFDQHQFIFGTKTLERFRHHENIYR
jgi:hypothetical protein